MPWLPFKTKSVSLLLKRFAKSKGEDFQICCLTFFDVLTFSMRINKKAFVARNRTVTQIAIYLIVNIFHKFVREFFNYGLNFICISGFNFRHYLRIYI